MQKLDPTKPVMLRDGRKAKIYQVHHNQIHGAWCDNGGNSWMLGCWNLDGEFGFTNKGFDLINVPEKPKVIEGWVNVYESENGTFYFSNLFITNQLADVERLSSAKSRIACVQVSFTEGEGL